MGWFESAIDDIISLGLAARAGMTGRPGAGIPALLGTASAARPLFIRDNPLMTIAPEPSGTLVAVMHGSVPLLGEFSGFVHLEALIGPAGTVTSIRTFSFELNLGVEHTWHATLAGRGGASGVGGVAGRGLIDPVGVGFEVGVLTGPGGAFALEVGVRWPVAVPVFPPFVGLTGANGMFAINMAPGLRDDDTVTPAAPAGPLDAAKWALNMATRHPMSLSSWRTAPAGAGAVGLGLRLISLADNGWLVTMDPVGFLVATPPLIIALTADGIALGSGSWTFKAALAFVGGTVRPVTPGPDEPAATSPTSGAAFVGELSVKYPPGTPDPPWTSSGSGTPASAPAPPPAPDPNREIIGGGGSIEIELASTGSFHVGTPRDPIYLSLLWSLAVIELFLAADSKGFAAGISASIGLKLPSGSGEHPPARASETRAAHPTSEDTEEEGPPVGLVLRGGIKLSVTSSVSPSLVEGNLDIFLEARIHIFFIRLGVVITFTGGFRVVSPSLFVADLRITVELPWPLPFIDLHANVTFFSDPTPPALKPPLMVGTYQPDDAGDPDIPGQATGVHGLSGRQWVLGEDAIWPDADLVIPFSERVADTTGTIAGGVVTQRRAGIYNLSHNIETIQIDNLDDGTTITDFGGVWAGDTNGDGASLHLLAADPFSWLYAHPGPASATPVQFTSLIEQRFGHGPSEDCEPGRRFGEVVVGSAGLLLSGFDHALTTRVLSQREVMFTFSAHDGTPLTVKNLSIVIVSDNPPILSGTSSGRLAITEETSLVYSGLRLYRISLPPDEAVRSFGFSLVQSDCLVLMLRYSVVHTTSRVTPARTILSPGRYRVTVRGSSRAHTDDTDPDGGALPDPVGNRWECIKEFSVTRPDTLRSYIATSPVGDDRVFGNTSAAWNPTTYGLGFPSYRRHTTAIRFRTSRIEEITGNIRLRIVGMDGATGESPCTFRPLPEGDATILPTAREWVESRGGTVDPDTEAVCSTSLLDLLAPDKTAPARIEILLDGSDSPVEAWRCLASRFGSFNKHVALDDFRIRLLHGPDGVRGAHHCPLPSAPAPGLSIRPPELVYPPADWLLPTPVTRLLGPLDSTSSARFCQLALALGSRFDDRGSTATAAGLTSVVKATVLDAIVIADGRTSALWLRTPEPLDWRRVSASLTVRHITPSTGCPSHFALRYSLGLDLSIMPSPDACSALLVASFGGAPVLIPRGVLDINLSFSAIVDGLATLRLPGDALEETATLTVVLEDGTDWPRPDDTVTVPASLLDRILLEVSRSGAADLEHLFEIIRTHRG